MIVKKAGGVAPSTPPMISILDSSIDTAYYVVPLRLDGGSLFHGDMTEQKQSA